VKHYVRYTDDFVVVHHDREYLVRLKNNIEQFLNDKLKMQLHPYKVHIRKYRQGIDFLGYVVLPNYKIVRAKTRRRILRKLKLRTMQFKDGAISEEKLRQSLASYSGVLSHANSYVLRQKIEHFLWESLRTPQE